MHYKKKLNCPRKYSNTVLFISVFSSQTLSLCNWWNSDEKNVISEHGWIKGGLLRWTYTYLIHAFLFFSEDGSVSAGSGNDPHPQHLVDLVDLLGAQDVVVDGARKRLPQRVQQNHLFQQRHPPCKPTSQKPRKLKGLRGSHPWNPLAGPMLSPMTSRSWSYVVG